MKLEKKQQTTQLAIGTDMPQYELTYRVTLYAENEDEANKVADKLCYIINEAPAVMAVDSGTTLEEVD
jgi:hypothetical protein